MLKEMVIGTELIDHDSGLLYRFTWKGSELYYFDTFRFGDVDAGEPELIPSAEVNLTAREVERLQKLNS